MFLFRFIKKQFNSTTVFIFVTTLVFYLVLWTVNPENKIIAASFIVLGFIYYFRLRDLRLSLLLTFLASLVILTGKTYTIRLIPPGVFPRDRWPEGYILSLIVSPKHVLSGVMLLTLIHDWKMWKHLEVVWGDIYLIAYFALTIISAFFASKQPEVSLVFSLLSLDGLVLYLYLRVYLPRWKQILPLIVGLSAAIITFESSISFQQFLASSPIGKNVESQLGIEFFGEAVDELNLGFRPVGTFSHANGLAGVITYLLPIILTSFFATPSSYLLTVLFLGLTTLVFTLSRSAWGAFALTTGWIFIYIRPRLKLKLPQISRGKSLLIFTVMFLMFGFFGLPRLKSSIYLFSPTGGGGYVRLQQIQNALGLIWRNPLLGVGSAMSVPEGLILDPKGILATFPSPVHNFYILMAAEVGIPATLLFLFFVLFYVRRILRQLKNQNIDRFNLATTIGLLSGSVTLLIVGLFQPYDYLVFIILGLIIATYGHQTGKGAV